MKKLIRLVTALCLILTLSLSCALATDTGNAGTTVNADGSVISTNPTADGSANGTGTAADGSTVNNSGATDGTAQAGTTVNSSTATDGAGAANGAATNPETAPTGSVTNADGTISNADGSMTIPGADSQNAGTTTAGTTVNNGVGITTVTTSTGTTTTGTPEAGTTAAGTTATGTTEAGTTAAGTTTTGTTTTTTGTTSTGTATTNTGTAGPIDGAVSGSAAATSGLTHYPASGKTRQKNVIMRKEADSKSKKVVTFSKKGQELTVTGEETVDGVLWYAVTSPKGKEGYVQGIYVSVEEDDRINAVKKSGAPKKMEVTIEASCADYQGLGKTWTKQYEVNGIELAEKGSTVEMAEGVEFSYLTCLVNKNANGISKEAYAPTAGDLTSGFTRTMNMIAISKKGKQIQWSITFTFMPEGTAAAARAAAKAEAASAASDSGTVKKATNTGSKKTTTSNKKQVVTYALDAASDKPTQAVVREIDHYEDREMEVTERVQTGTKTYYAYETDEKGKSVMVEKTKPVYTTQTVRKVVSVPVYKDELPPGYTSSSSSSSSSAANSTTNTAGTTTAETTATAGTTATAATTTTTTTAGTTTTAAGTTAAAVPEADDLEEETVTETVTETAETAPAVATTTTQTTETAATTTTTETVPAATTTTTTTTTETVPAATTQTAQVTTTTTETVPAATTTTTETVATTTAQTTETAPAAAGATKTKDQLTAEYSLMFFGPVNNDATGNLRAAQYFAAATQEQFARDYYYAYFTDNNEIHALINPMTQTTAKISVFGGSKLLVVIYSYVNGEESNAAVLFTGNMTGAYQIDLATGEIVNMMPAG